MKPSTLWDNGVSKSVISKGCFEKFGCTGCLDPCTGKHLSSTSGNNFQSIEQITRELKLGTLKVKHNFLVCKHLTHCLIPGLHYHHKIRIGTEEKLFLHKNGSLTVHAR